MVFANNHCLRWAMEEWKHQKMGETTILMLSCLALAGLLAGMLADLGANCGSGTRALTAASVPTDKQVR